jgi:2-(1,2-epoxy-1,2-dihydrophenyl)acetyl-CoA isomerase
MSCDLVVASDRAAFEWAYHKTGLCGAESCTFFLPQLLGLRKALELVLLNPRLSASEACELGLVNRVFPTATFEREVMALATQLADGPTRAYGVTKSLLNQAAGVDRLDFHLDQELQHLTRIADQPEFAEGLAAFFGRRAPRFHETEIKETV